MRKVMVVVLSVLAVLALAVAPASAGGREVRREGACSARSDWKLKVKQDNSALELEFEVDQNVTGDAWRVRIFQNGDRIFMGRRVTRGASGSFTVSMRPNDRAGADRFVARALNPGTNETCRGALAF